MYGNTDAFLHAHVVPRCDWEPDGYRSMPPFGYPRHRWADPRYQLSWERHADLHAQLRARLLAGMAGVRREP